jgi:hypothetical protein
MIQVTVRMNNAIEKALHELVKEEKRQLIRQLLEMSAIPADVPVYGKSPLDDDPVMFDKLVKVTPKDKAE